MSSLLAKLKKNSKIEQTEVLDKSALFNDKDMIPTEIPMLNVALSGSLDGGLSSGLTVLAGPSKHFKSSYSLIMAAAYLKKYPEAIMLFYDSEFGSPQQYFKTFGIDVARVLHTPITNVEELKFDLVNQMNNLERGEKVIVVIDSIGNLASKKEVEDAMNEKSVADMSRAKALKGLFRMVTPYLTLKNIPLVAINHSYKTLEMYSKDVMSGGTGIYYSANAVWMLGRQQDKDDDGLNGYHFIINIDKSRFVKEKSKIPISVSFNGGVEKYSGLLEIALEGGFVTKPTVGWYSKKGETDKYREAETYTATFWDPVLKSDEFKQFVKDKYTVGYRSAIQQLETETSEDDE
jgi:RecA/RadA recombinase